MVQTWFVATENSPAGRKLAQQLLEQGDRVVTTARNALLLEDLKTRHATTLTIYTADAAGDANNDVVNRAFAEHGPIDVIVGPDSLMRVALPHLVAQGGGRVIQPPDATNPETTVRITATSRETVDLDSWLQTTIATAHSQTSLTEDQLRRLQPGMFGQPPPVGR